ncbi:MAG: hypothetical protein LBR73_02290 [Oscillospiraceae bacterium]|jgi:hypothetical protein|nr:hypothetical protein [Oscillospiraceae bacterium]
MTHNTYSFGGLLVFIAAHNEVQSLRATVQGFQECCSPADVRRIVLFLAPFCTKDCEAQAQALARCGYPIPVTVYKQAGRDYPKEVQAYLQGQTDVTHAVFWIADMDIDLQLLPQMTEQSKENPAAVVTVSRFLQGGGLPRHRRRLDNLLSTAFAWGTRLLYLSRQTDPHFFISIFPVCDLQRVVFHERTAAAGFEFILVFERMGKRFLELPVQQRERSEGASGFNIKRKLYYLKPLLRVRFTPKRKLFEEVPHAKA